MPVITIRVDEAVRDDLDDLATSRGTTVSALVRGQIDALIGRERAGGEERGPVALPQVTRYSLALQHRTLDRLNEVLGRIDPDYEDPDFEDGYYKHAVETLESGYSGEYDELFRGIDPEMSRQECGLLWDIFGMFSTLKLSLERLSPESRHELGEEAIDQLTFQGFDGNDPLELRLLVYARFLIGAGRWNDFAEHFTVEGGMGNSHFQALPGYLQMLKTYQPLYEQLLRQAPRRGRALFTVEALREIAGH